MTSTSPVVNKKFGATKRADIARKAIKKIMSDKNNILYFSKDMDLAKRLDVSRHTICSIREELGIMTRTQRIVARLNSLNLSKYTINDLTLMLNAKYQNLYKILKANDLKTKADVPPIESLQKFQKKNRKKKAIKQK